MFGNLEGEETRGKRRVEENGYPPSYLNVSKIKYREGIISLFIVCNFVNMIRVNLIIHLGQHFYALLFLQISPTWEN